MPQDHGNRRYILRDYDGAESIVNWNLHPLGDKLGSLSLNKNNPVLSGCILSVKISHEKPQNILSVSRYRCSSDRLRS